MEKTEIHKILVEHFGYSEASAENVSKRILSMDADTYASLLRLFETYEADLSLSCGEYSIASLIEGYGMKPPAAYLTISDLKKDYATMSALLSGGIK